MRGYEKEEEDMDSIVVSRGASVLSILFAKILSSVPDDIREQIGDIVTSSGRGGEGGGRGECVTR